MVVAGFLLLATAMQLSDRALPFTIGWAVAVAPAAVIAHLLLSYPDGLSQHEAALRRVSSTVDAKVGAPMARFLDHVSGTPAADLAAEYVATFDQRKRCCLYLTYYAYGDTRNRGMALLTLKQSYAAAGLVGDIHRLAIDIDEAFPLRQPVRHL